jgi:type I restriction enzyme S subunit
MSFTEAVQRLVESNENGLMSAHGSWRRVPLASVATVLNGFAFPSGNFSVTDGVPLLRIRDILGSATEACYNGKFDPEYWVRTGDLVVGMDGDFNCALWKGPPALLNQRVCKITVDETLYRLKFLSYALPGYLKAINSATSSVTVKHLSSRTVEEIPLPLPPGGEQDRIVAEIEKQLTRLDDAVAALKRVQANLKRYRASVLKAACEGRLVPTEAELARNEGRSYESGEQLLARILKDRRAKWEADQLVRISAGGRQVRDEDWKRGYREPSSPAAAEMARLPEGWSWASLDALAEIKGGITKGQKRNPREVLRSVPYLRVANVQRGYLDLKEVRSIEATEAEISELLLLPGDVLFNEGGDRDKLGRGWVWEGAIPVCIHQNHVFRARLNAHMQPKFVSWYSNSQAQHFFFRQGKQSTNLASINMTKLRALPVPVPPAAEQHRIACELERADSTLGRLTAQLQAAVERARVQRQAILATAFSGKLVPQDPNDEPASVLLERIKAERKTQTKAKRRGKK